MYVFRLVSNIELHEMHAKQILFRQCSACLEHYVSSCVSKHRLHGTHGSDLHHHLFTICRYFSRVGKNLCFPIVLCDIVLLFIMIITFVLFIIINILLRLKYFFSDYHGVTATKTFNDSSNVVFLDEHFIKLDTTKL